MSRLISAIERLLGFDGGGSREFLLNRPTMYLIGAAFVLAKVVAVVLLFVSYGRWTICHTIILSESSIVISIIILGRWYYRTGKAYAWTDKALKAAEARNEILAIISHEIRASLSVMILTVQNLRQRSNVLAHANELQVLEESSQALLALVDKALDCARWNSNHLDPHNVPVDLRDLVNNVIKALTPKFDEKRLSVRVDINESIPGSILSDALMLRLILSNLVDNAVKHAQGNVTIRAEACKDGNFLRVEVIDAGPGVPGPLQREIFEPFKKGPTKSGAAVEGVGLGLALCKRFSAALGGDIGVVSDVGNGATFWFEIPLRPTPPQFAEVRDYSHSCRGLAVLVVENHLFNRLMLKEQLEREGIDVTDVGGIDEAIDVLSAASFDVILTDLYLGDKKGTDLALLARARGIETPIIVLTASAKKEDITLCSSAGIDEIMTKPLSLEIFRHLVSELR